MRRVSISSMIISIAYEWGWKLIVQVLLQVPKTAASFYCCNSSDALLIVFFYTNHPCDCLLFTSDATGQLQIQRTENGKWVAMESVGSLLAVCSLSVETSNESFCVIRKIASSSSSFCFYGCDVFNQIWKFHIHLDESTCSVQSSLLYSNPSWKVDLFASADSTLVVCCEDGHVYSLKDDAFSPLHTFDPPRCIRSVLSYSGQILLIDTEGNLFHCESSTSPPLDPSGTNHLILNNTILYISNGELKYSRFSSSSISASFPRDSSVRCMTLDASSRLLLVHSHGSVTLHPLDIDSAPSTNSAPMAPNDLMTSSRAFHQLGVENSSLFNTLSMREKAREFLAGFPSQLEAEWRVDVGGNVGCRLGVSLEGVSCVQWILRGVSSECCVKSVAVRNGSGVCDIQFKGIPLVLNGVCEAELRCITWVGETPPVTKTISLGHVSLIDMDLSSRLGTSIPRGPDKHVTVSLVETPSQGYSLDSFGLKERIGSVHCQLLSSGSSHQILLQSSDERSLLLVRSHVLQRMLDQWNKGTKGWMINYPQQQSIEECLHRLETLPDSIPEQIKELEEVNTVLASLLQLFCVCFKLMFILLSNHYSPKRRNASRTEYSGIVAVDSKWKGIGRRVSFLEIKESLGQIIRNEDLGKRRKVAVREEMFVLT